jgi:hypothetical protein
VGDPQEYELPLLPELLPLQVLELDDVCSPWYAVRVGRLEGTSKSGQLPPWAASI